MAKYTKQQIQNWNSKLQNGFEVDLNHLLIWNEKQAVKEIPLDQPGKTLTATLMYCNVKSSSGFGYTGQVQPHIHFQVWTDTRTPGMRSSYGLGIYVPYGQQQPKKLFTGLCKLSCELTEEKIMQMYLEEKEKAKPSPVLIGG